MTQGTQTGALRQAEGWDGAGDGRQVREGTWVNLWLILVDEWQKTTKFCKAIIFQLKILKHTHTQKGGLLFIIMSDGFTALDILRMDCLIYTQKQPYVIMLYM